MKSDAAIPTAMKMKEVRTPTAQARGACGGLGRLGDGAVARVTIQNPHTRDRTTMAETSCQTIQTLLLTVEGLIVRDETLAGVVARPKSAAHGLWFSRRRIDDQRR